MSKIITVILKAEEPLVITDGSVESMAHETLKFIPGNMLLGAFVPVWKKDHPKVVPDENDEFRALFLNGTVSWGHARPLAGSEPTYPVPLSFRKIKGHDGLPKFNQEDKGDSTPVNFYASESTVDDEAADKTKGTTDVIFSTYQKVNKNEALKYKRITGFMTKGCCQPEIRQMWTMHTAISSERSVAEGQLFGYSAIAPDTAFSADILCQDDALFPKLKSILNKVSKIKVGHARSAGYGLVAIKVDGERKYASSSLNNEFCLYLSSSYIPKHSWERPLDALKNEIAQALQCNVDFITERCSCGFEEIEGFNGLWRLPRRSRTAIIQGSVLKVKLNGNPTGILPNALGGFTQEGYGSYMINPEFMQDICPKIKFQRIAKKDQSISAPSKNSPLVKVMRRRAIMRLAHDYAVKFLDSKEITQFLDDVRGKSKPSSSQRGNIRQLINTVTDHSLWLEWFKEILNKTPGEQWLNSDARWPHIVYVACYQSLADIMQDLLNETRFKELFGSISSIDAKASKELFIVGGKLDDKEQKIFDLEYHRQALLELLIVWDKAARNLDTNSPIKATAMENK